jgi:hypothetical protein
VRSRRSLARRRGAGLIVVVLIAVVVAAVLPRSSNAAYPSGWNIVTTPAGSATGSDVLLGSACPNAWECWAVGASISNGGGAAPLVEEWNGSSWVDAPNPAPPAGEGYALLSVRCLTGSDCWAVGAVLGGAQNNPLGTLTETWNGSVWTVIPSPTPAGAVGAVLEGVSCASQANCWAVGFTTDANGDALTMLTESWNGSAWSIVASAPSGQSYDQLNSVTCTSPSSCWAVGSAGAVQQNPGFLPIYPAAAGNQGLVEHWDGISWSVVPSVAAPSPDGSYLTAVTCVSTADCWASGSTTDSTGSANTTLMEHWNGSGWSTVPSANPPDQPGDILSGVTCLDADTCWAVGASNTNTGGGGGPQFDAFIEAWDGVTWSIQPSPNVTAASLLGSVACVRGDSCWTVGAAVTPTNGGSYRTLIEQMDLPPSSNQGLLMAARDGGIFTFGDAGFHGSMGGQRLNQPVVGTAATPDGGGYWEVASDGGIFAFGDANFYGSMGSQHLNQPVVGIAATPDGGGYWEVASDGGIFAFGDANFYGSMGSQHLNQPVVGIAATPDGGGYWEVASDGGIFAFGDANFYGSMGGSPLGAPISGLATTPDGGGYWMVAADGGVFAFGNAGYLGSVPAQGVADPKPVVSISPAPDGRGYWLSGSNGSLYHYGDAVFLGSLGGLSLAEPIVGAASS